MYNHHVYYSLSIHPGRTNVYFQSTASRRYVPIDYYEEDSDKNSTTKQPIQFKDNYHQGRISRIAKRKISRAIEYLIYMARSKTVRNPFNGKYFTFKVNFVTLSLASKQIHTDQVIKSNLLDQLLHEAKKRWNVDLYVWRAEKQKNGRIHFHILTDKFIPYNELRNVWNRIQGKLGYIAGYRKDRLEEHKHGFHYEPKYAEYWHHKNKPKAYKWDYNKQLKAYHVGNQTGWDNPNSVDVHSLEYIGNIKAYLTKYMSKNEEYTEEQKRMFNNLPVEKQLEIREEQFVSGQLWSSSGSLANLTGGNMEMCSVVQEELDQVFQNDKKCVYHSDYFHVYTVDIATLRRLDCQLLIACFEDFIRKKFPDRYLSVII